MKIMKPYCRLAQDWLVPLHDLLYFVDPLFSLRGPWTQSFRPFCALNLVG